MQSIDLSNPCCVVLCNLCCVGDLDKARRKAKMAEFTSDLDTVASDVEKEASRQKRARNLVPDEDEESRNTSSRSPTPARKKLVAKKRLTMPPPPPPSLQLPACTSPVSGGLASASSQPSTSHCPSPTREAVAKRGIHLFVQYIYTCSLHV